jgi:hypothetical protein
MNPAAAVRGPKHVVKTGKTPVLEGDEWRKLLASITTVTLRDLRDRRRLTGRSATEETDHRHCLLLRT